MDVGATIVDWSNATYRVSKAHGFEEEPINIDQKLVLAIGELVEAQNELRDGRAPNELYYLDGKPEGFGIELADAVIRILNLAKSLHINLELCMELKQRSDRKSVV